jgi:antitoxin (DNA-binding transcriptional repressor) of toxin-antitoxin stability system
MPSSVAATTQCGTSGMDNQLSPEDVAQLQRWVLTAALTGEPLPGGAAIELPELVAAVKDGRRIIVLQDNVDSAALSGVTTPLVLANRSRLAELAAAGADVMYVNFRPIQRHGDAATVVLEVGLERASGSSTLGGVVAEFPHNPSGWTTANPPAAFAT